MINSQGALKLSRVKRQVSARAELKKSCRA